MSIQELVEGFTALSEPERCEFLVALADAAPQYFVSDEDDEAFEAAEMGLTAEEFAAWRVKEDALNREQRRALNRRQRGPRR